MEKEIKSISYLFGEMTFILSNVHFTNKLEKENTIEAFEDIKDGIVKYMEKEIKSISYLFGEMTFILSNVHFTNKLEKENTIEALEDIKDGIVKYIDNIKVK